MAKRTSKETSFFSAGLGLGLGAGVAQIIFLLLGCLFLIPGAILFYKERKKPVEERDKSIYVVSLILALIGAILALGVGIGLVFNIIGEMV